MSITTKTGDHGQTSLYSGERVSKAHPRIELLGALDELNSALGLIGGLKSLQEELFELGALVANPKAEVDEAQWLASTQALEEKIEGLEKALPPLRHFILPGGHPDAAQAHMARALCRRAERLAVSFQDELPQEVRVYLNRLSDYLFLFARKINHDTKTPEVLWKA